MTMREGILYFLVGDKGGEAKVIKGDRTFGGWSWADLSLGYYQQPRVPWGFGHTLAAYDLARELQSVVREAIIVSAGVTVLPDFLPSELQPQGESIGVAAAKDEASVAADWRQLPQCVESWITNGDTDVYRRARERFDRLVILRVIEHTDGNQNQAAEILGISRVTLRTRLRQMGLLIERTLTSPSDVDTCTGRGQD